MAYLEGARAGRRSAGPARLDVLREERRGRGRGGVSCAYGHRGDHADARVRSRARPGLSRTLFIYVVAYPYNPYKTKYIGTILNILILQHIAPCFDFFPLMY